MPLLKIDIVLDSDQFESKSADVQKVTGKSTVAIDSLTAKVTAFSFAFNQVSDVINKVADVIAAPIQKFSALESAMANVESLGVPNIGALTDEVLSMGDKVSVPLESLTGGLYEVVSAGVDAANQIEVLGISARAAKAGLAETSEALKLGSSVIKGYGLEWSDTESIMDKAFQTVKLGQTNFKELAGNLGAVVPLAGSLKIRVDELFGSFATLTGVTGNTSEVATQLKAVEQGLAAPTKELTELIKAQGHATVEQAVAAEGLIGIIDILKEATKGSSAEMTKYFGSVEAVNALLALTGSQYDTFIDKTNQMTGSAGAMTDAFNTQNDTIKSQVQLLENRWDRMMVRAVELAVPFANSLFDIALAATDSRSSVEKMAEEIEDLQSQMSQLDDVDSLIARYDELQQKTNLSETEHKELKDVIQQLSELYPGAIWQVNQYGEAIGINADKVKFLVDQQKALLRVQSDEKVEQLRDKLIKQINFALNSERRLQIIQESGNVMRTRSGFIYQDLGERVENFRKKLAENSHELTQNILQLSNFFDFSADQDTLKRELNLNEAQVQLLISRWKELNKIVDETTAKNGQTNIDEIKPIISPPAPVEIPVVPVPDSKEALPADAIFDLDAIREQTNMIDLQFDTLQLNEEEYFTTKKELLASYLSVAEEIYGKESKEVLQARQEQLAFDEEYITRRQEIEQMAVESTLGSLSTLMQSAQGANEDLFAIGKGAAFAETIYNTYASATAAYKAMAGIPIVGPGLAIAAAAAAIASGLANAQRIAATKFERRESGGLLGDEIRTVLAGDFGGGENRLIIANDGEFIVNRAATAANIAILEAINRGQRFVPVRGFQGGGQVGGSGSGIVARAELDQFKSEIVDAIRSQQIVLKGTLEGQEFLRENYNDFQKSENKRTAF